MKFDQDKVMVQLKEDFRNGLKAVFVNPELMPNSEVRQRVRFFLMGGLCALQAAESVYWMRFAEMIKPMLLQDFDPSSWRP